MRILLLACLLLTACPAATPRDFACNPLTQCPTGAYCAADGYCALGNPPDAGELVDAGPVTRDAGPTPPGAGCSTVASADICPSQCEYLAGQENLNWWSCSGSTCCVGEEDTVDAGISDAGKGDASVEDLPDASGDAGPPSGWHCDGGQGPLEPNGFPQCDATATESTYCQDDSAGGNCAAGCIGDAFTEDAGIVLYCDGGNPNTSTCCYVVPN